MSVESAAVTAAIAAVQALVVRVSKSAASGDVVTASVRETLGNGVTPRLGCR